MGINIESLSDFRWFLVTSTFLFLLTLLPLNITLTMPYFDHTMATTMSKLSNTTSANSTTTSTVTKNDKKIRTMPATACSKISSATSTVANEKIVSHYKVDFELGKLEFMRNLLKAEVRLD